MNKLITNNKIVMGICAIAAVFLSLQLGFNWRNLSEHDINTYSQIEVLVISIYCLNKSSHIISRTFWACMCALLNVELAMTMTGNNNEVNHLDAIHILIAAIVFSYVIIKDTLPYITCKWKNLKMPSGRHLKK